MLELARDLLPLLRDGTAVAVVTVTRVARSAPRGAGASMAVTADGRVLGSISGGCVEGDAIVLAHSARVGATPLTARLGFSDDTAHAAGLACGGSVDVVAYSVSPEPAVIDALEAVVTGRGVTVGVMLAEATAGRVLDEGDLRKALADTAPLADANTNATTTPDPSGIVDDLIARRETAVVADDRAGHDVLVLSQAPMPRLIVVGAGEHAAALCRVATAAGFAVTVCDVWETLVTRERFPDAVELVAGLPHEHLTSIDPRTLDARTAVCVLTHDERLDVPALAAALALPVGFVGAMGARGTVTHRGGLLREAGVSAADIARIHSPLGLDLGGASPDETAISVLAEVVAARHGGSGHPLRDRTGALHRRPSTRMPAARAEVEASDAEHPTSAGDIPDAPPALAPACGIPLPTGAP